MGERKHGGGARRPPVPNRGNDKPNGEPFPTETLFLDYIRTAKHSALPPRLILLFVVLASAHAFLAFWNSLSNSWMNERVNACRNALAWIHRTPDLVLDSDELDDLISAAGIYSILEIQDKKELELAVRAMLSSLESNRNEFIRLVRVPLVGVIFDINDLGMFSGFVLIVLLTMFRYTLAREAENLQLAYTFAARMDHQLVLPDEDPLRYRTMCYDLLAMSQVIIVPAKRGPVTWYWRHMPKAGLALPLLVQAAILIYDLASRRIGLIFSSFNTVVVFMVSFSCLLGIIVLVFSSFGIWRQIEEFWATKADEVA